MKQHAIGIFDSGLGGLTVVQELLKQLPSESILYFGDTARVPYGNKSEEIIQQYALQNAALLNQYPIKALLVACNTATAYSLEILKEQFSPLPVIGVIDPGVERAVSVTRNGRIAILGTEGTIRSNAYQKALLKKNSALSLFPVACPLFVPLVEEHFLDHPATPLIIKEYLKEMKSAAVDTVLLGCTHYPFLKPLLQKELGDEVVIVDSASCCGQQLRLLLESNDLLSNQSLCSHQFLVSDDPKRFQIRAEELLQRKLESVALIPEQN